MKILERMRLEALIKNIPTTGTETPDPKLEKELKDTKKQLNSILNNWKFGDQPIKSAQEFLNKFAPWINTQLEQQKELQDFLKEYSTDNLRKLKETWQNTEQDYQEQIKELKEEIKKPKGEGDWETTNAELIKGLEKEVKGLETERDELTRDKKTLEQETLSLTNKLKNKNEEVNKKLGEIERIKKEKSQSEIALNKKLEELKKKYSKQGQLLDGEQTENNKLIEKIESLEEKIKGLTAENLRLIKEISKGDILE